MPEAHGESPQNAEGGQTSEGSVGARAALHGPPLSPNIRRHLGLTLRTVYAIDPAEPLDERMQALLYRLGESLPDLAAD